MITRHPQMTLNYFLKPSIRMLILGCLLTVNSLFSQVWELVWSDEFDNSTLDTNFWSHDTGNGCPDLCGWGNGELEYYLPDNATLVDGNLVLTAKADSIGEYGYTSAKITTRGKAGFTYGRFEIRAKLPEGQGLWPAFWMMPEEDFYGGWAGSGEIDIMELIGHEPNRVYGTIHYGGEYPWNVFSGAHYDLEEGSFQDDYHTFALEWVPGKLSWFVDDSLYSVQNDWYTTSGKFPAPFDRPFHLILNVAVGGVWPGHPDSTTNFPQEMVVDYVRVYEFENVQPEISITYPVEGTLVNPGDNLEIMTTVFDVDGQIEAVEFYQGEVLIGSDDQPPYSLLLSDIPAGCYQVIARARDNLGGVAADTVELTVDECSQSSYSIISHPVPGIIEAEHYDLGGSDIAYSDTDPNENTGDGIRQNEGVDISEIHDYGFSQAISDIQDGEWIEYSIDVGLTGSYFLDLRVLPGLNEGRVRLLDENLNALTDSIHIPSLLTADSLWTTVHYENLTLDAGKHIFRLAFDQGDFMLNNINFIPDTSALMQGVIVDDFESGKLSGWTFIDEEQSHINAQVRDDWSYQGDYSLQTMWAGSGNTQSPFGSAIKDFPNDNQPVLPLDPWINIMVAFQRANPAVTSFDLEIILKEDLDGNGWVEGQEDAFQFVRTFAISDFHEHWMNISVAVDSMFNLATGGNGRLDGKLDEIELRVSNVEGSDPSNIVLWIDDIIFTSSEPLKQYVLADFEAKSSQNFNFFAGHMGSGSGSLASEHPKVGHQYFSTSWSGDASASIFFGGFYHNFKNSLQIPIPEDPWLNAWVYHDSSGNTINQYTLEFTLREDIDGGGWLNGKEDSFRYDCIFTRDNFNNRWERKSIPLGRMLDLGTGGNGRLDNSIDEVVVVVSQVDGEGQSKVAVDLDHIWLSSGHPAPPEAPVSVDFDEPRAIRDMKLNGAYPNPFNPATTIRFTLARASRVQLTIFDISGRFITTIEDTYRRSGNYEVIWAGRDAAGRELSTGVYFCQMLVGKRSQTLKLLLLR